jgi:hypothetical protein
MKTLFLAVLAALLLGGVAYPAAPGLAAAEAQAPSLRLRLPLIMASSVATGSGCPAASGNQYAAGPAMQWDQDSPVRPAAAHADKNLALRGYTPVNAGLGLVSLGSDDPNQPPQLATLFSPTRLPVFSSAYQIYTWNWAPSPTPGTRGGLDRNWPLTVLGMRTAAGEPLRLPASGYDIGAGMEALVIFADADSVTFKYTREDSVGPNGYTLHVDNICTDPNLLALYNSLDRGARYVYYGAADGTPDYNLPNLPAGQAIGTARGTEIRVGIVDSGAFMDPRSADEWWQIR